MLFARVQQDSLLEATSDLEACHCGSQRIGTVMQPVLTPAEHLGILTDFAPLTVFGQMGTQGGGRLPVGRGQLPISNSQVRFSPEAKPASIRAFT
jgi:hypothetical protein